MDKRKRFYVALALYAVLGVAIWLTVGNDPIPLGALVPMTARSNSEWLWKLGSMHLTVRDVTLVILGLFVLRTVLHWYAEQAREKRESEQSSS